MPMLRVISGREVHGVLPTWVYWCNTLELLRLQPSFALQAAYNIPQMTFLSLFINPVVCI